MPIIGLNLDVYTGGQPLLVPPTTDRRVLKAYVAQMHGCLFIGGADYPPAWYGQKNQAQTNLVDPLRAITDSTLAMLVLKTRMPVLGICGGHQLISIAQGGKLIQHIARTAEHQNENYHPVIIDGKGILSSLFGNASISVNSNHHQAIDPRAVGRGLKVTAWAEDGTVEAIEGTGRRFLLGVQWHPERIGDKKHRGKIFGAFIEAARK